MIQYHSFRILCEYWSDIRASLRRNRAGFTLMEIVLVMGIFSTTVLLVTNIFVGSTKLQQRSIVSQRLTGDARFTLESMARTVRAGSVDYDFYYARTPYVTPDSMIPIDDPTQPLHVLSTIDQDGNRTIFRRKSLDPVNDPWGFEADGGLLELADTIEVCLESSICVNQSDYANSSKALCNTDLDCSDNPGETCQLSCSFPEAWSDITPEGVRLTGGSEHPGEPYGLKFIITPPVDPNELTGVDLGEYRADDQPIVTIMLMTRALGDELDERKTNLLQTAVSSRLYRR